ncbi:MAG: hypothetical protein K6T67_14175, partial [Alicyclobacillus sp.]|nr:hypothetical protein [Alicyclobacillus sp.]
MEFPKWRRIRQHFEGPVVEDIPGRVRDELIRVLGGPSTQGAAPGAADPASGGTATAASAASAASAEGSGRIRPGMRVAVTAGSRGIANIPIILQSVIRTLKQMGADPFIVP